METKKITDLHHEHVEWLNKLSFYSDDLKALLPRLEEVVKKNTHKEVLAMAEHFQNQFKVQKEQIDILHHDIKEHDDYIENLSEKDESASDQRQTSDHKQNRERVERFEEMFHEFRKEFYSWLSKVM